MNRDSGFNFRLIVVGITLAIIGIFIVQSVATYNAEQEELGDIADRAACEYSDAC